MKTIIAGSRRIPEMNLNCDKDWQNAEVRKAMMELLEEAIKKSKFKPTEVVSGNAWGMDHLGEEWSHNNNLPIKLFKANWDKFGKGAGPIRNKTMAEYCDCAIILMAENSSGSLNMIQEMKKVNKPFFAIIVGVK